MGSAGGAGGEPQGGAPQGRAPLVVDGRAYEYECFICHKIDAIKPGRGYPRFYPQRGPDGTCGGIPAHAVCSRQCDREYRLAQQRDMPDPRARVLDKWTGRPDPAKQEPIRVRDG